MNYWRGKRALVTGGSSGLGLVLAGVLVEHGARVTVVARGQERLEAAARELYARGGEVFTFAGDMAVEEDVSRLATSIQNRWEGLDFLAHCAGRSMRGTVLATPVDEFRRLIETNFLSAVRCAQVFGTSLAASRGHLVLVGSLASKVAAGYLGAYPVSKFPLAALAQQLRMEMAESGLHTLLVCPGPIARAADQSGATRYAEQAPDVPASAHQPGGGARVRLIDPRWLSEKILNACETRKAELVVPRRARLLFALSQLSPRFGDWCLKKMTT